MMNKLDELRLKQEMMLQVNQNLFCKGLISRQLYESAKTKILAMRA